ATRLHRYGPQCPIKRRKGTTDVPDRLLEIERLIWPFSGFLEPPNDSERFTTLPEQTSARSSSPFTVLRFADAGRTTSSSFNRRRTGSRRANQSLAGIQAPCAQSSLVPLP